MPPRASKAGDATTPARRALSLHAQTARALGVDFLPRAVRARPTLQGVDAVVERESASSPPPSARREPDAGVDAHRAAPTSLGAPPSDKAAALADLERRHAQRCPHCTTAKGHTNLVFGDGDPNARLMFVGEAPGAEEDRQGVPFVGASGKKLNEMIQAMGLRREDVYIANILKARPPNNDTPTPEEAANCGPFLLEQIEIIRPRVLVTLGAPAAKFLLQTTEPISALRGRWHDCRGIPLMPTFHPAYLLRNYTPEVRRKVWSDLQMAMQRLGETSS